MFAAMLALVSCQLFGGAPEATIEPTEAGVPTTMEIPATSTPIEPLPPTREPSATPTEAEQPPVIKVAPAPVFAVYKEPAVEGVAAVFNEPIAEDLSNVQVPFILSEGQRQILAEQGFVVNPGEDKEFFTLYEKARYDNEPIFVTSDSLLHVYHLLFDKVLRTAEREHFIPLLHSLNEAMLAETDAQYQELKGTAWEEAALRTVAFIGVGSKLLDAQVEVPAYAADLAEAELALIEEAGGIMDSPLFPGLEFGEDYSQYIPRGHYTLSEELKSYFRSMMWYGRMTFRLKSRDPEVGRAETRSALLLVQALRNAEVDGRPALEAWTDLYSPTVFFVGHSDDLLASQYMEVMDMVYGPGAGLSDLADDARLDQFIALANTLPAPKILGMVIMDTDEVEETTKGLRFMGQRFVPDAYIFRQLIYRNVGTRENRRGLPMGLDLLAAMGSEQAYQHLEELGETGYENYPQQMEKVRGWLGSLTVEEWTETLYNTWLYSFYPLLEVPGEGYPSFMQSPAWVDKQLNAVLGSWAELKHDTILYAKQVYAELGGGPPPPPPVPPDGYVEPVPEFYARLAALTAMTRTGLEQRGLLADEDSANLTQLENLALDFKLMAEKELSGEPLTTEEYEQIRYYGGDLEHLTMASADSDVEDPYAPKFMEEQPQAAVIADVATDPAPQLVLEEAVGRINPIYVVVPMVDSQGQPYLQVAKGGVFSYYEFPWPLNDRLTDEKWRQMLDEGQAPEPPAWTDSFLAQESNYSDWSGPIRSFEEQLTSAYWYQDPYFLPEKVDFSSQVISEIEDWRTEHRYLGHQLVRLQFRSFDAESATRAIVTARETWQDKLFEYTGEYPDYLEDTLVDERGPYDLEVTYTVEFDGNSWAVTNVVYQNQPPAW
jgi:hypothetical protein